MSRPLIGFSAAPWTLLFYMVGGSSKKNTDAGMTWLKEHPEDSKTLLNLLTKIVIEYLSAQLDAGAHMLQVFEAMGMMIDEKNFDEFDRSTARDTVGGRAGLQGNYDPRELILAEDGSKTVETVRETTRELLEALGCQRLIANLGEGLGGKESPELVEAFVNAVHEESEKMIKAGSN